MIAKRFNKFLVLALIVGMLTRLLLLLILASDRIPQLEKVTSGGDATGYVQLAMNILEKNKFAFADGNATAYRMPGYPLFLAFLYKISGSWSSVRLTQIFVDLMAIALVYKVTKRITSNQSAPIVAVLCAALNPLAIISSVSLLPETLAFGLMALVVFFLIGFPNDIRLNWILPAVFGAVLYLKPTLAAVALAIVIEYAVYQYLRSHTIKRAVSSILVSAIVFTIMLSPWVIRNYHALHGFIPLTTSSGSNLYGGNNPHADGGFVLSEPYVASGMSELESDHFYSARAKIWIRSNFKEFIALLPAKAARFFWPLSLGTSGSIPLPSFALGSILVTVILFNILILFGVVFLLAGRSYWQAVVLITPLMSLLSISLITFGAARFMLPAFPALAVLCGLGIGSLGARLPFPRKQTWQT